MKLRSKIERSSTLIIFDAQMFMKFKKKILICIIYIIYYILDTSCIANKSTGVYYIYLYI